MTTANVGTWMCQLSVVLLELKAYMFCYSSGIIMQLLDTNGLGQLMFAMEIKCNQCSWVLLIKTDTREKCVDKSCNCLQLRSVIVIVYGSVQSRFVCLFVCQSLTLHLCYELSVNEYLVIWAGDAKVIRNCWFISTVFLYLY